MNIIFGEALETIPDNYTALELDTFRLPPDGRTVTAYCIVEKIGLNDFPTLEATCQLHKDVVANFKNRHWDYCEKAIRDGLMGQWNGEVDSFYEEMLNRIGAYRLNPPSETWSPVIDRSQ